MDCCYTTPYIFTFLFELFINTITLSTLFIKRYFESKPRHLNLFYDHFGLQWICNLLNIFINYGTTQILDISTCSSYYIFLWSDLFCVTLLQFILYHYGNRIMKWYKSDYFIQSFYIKHKVQKKVAFIQYHMFLFIYLLSKTIVIFAILYPLENQWNKLTQKTLFKLTTNLNIQYILIFSVFAFIFHLNQYFMLDSLIKKNYVVYKPPLNSNIVQNNDLSVIQLYEEL